MKRMLVLTTLGTLALAASSFASNPPATVTNFNAVTGKTTATAEFQIPSDDGALGRATFIQIRRQSVALNNSNWTDGTIVYAAENTVGAGNWVCLELTLNGPLTCNTGYYWAVRTSDEEDNESDVSNCDYSPTLPCSPSSYEVQCILLLPQRNGEMAPPVVEARGADLIALVG